MCRVFLCTSYDVTRKIVVCEKYTHFLSSGKMMQKTTNLSLSNEKQVIAEGQLSSGANSMDQDQTAQHCWNASCMQVIIYL